MTQLQQEAEKYCEKKHNHDYQFMYNKVEQETINDFIAGAESDYVKQQIIKAKIEVLQKVLSNAEYYAVHPLHQSHIQSKINQLKNELK